MTTSFNGIWLEEDLEGVAVEEGVDEVAEEEGDLYKGWRVEMYLEMFIWTKKI